MTTAPYLIAVDAGTTGVRAVLFDRLSVARSHAYTEIPVLFPTPGSAEQDARAIWEATLRVIREAVRSSGVDARQIGALGIANQRGTTVVWERRSGRPLAPAISWQDLRTAERARHLQGEGVMINAMASATKLEWLLDHSPGARARAEAGALCFGTIDTWLVWHLTGGAAHVTDASNASCTALFNPFTRTWDEGVLALLTIPEAMLPRIAPTSCVYGTVEESLLGAPIPVAAAAGDQQAAMFGQIRWQPGTIKCTYGTGAMVDLNTGETPRLSTNGAYPLVLWLLDGVLSYCLEGTTITAGAAIQWMRDGLGIIASAEETAALAASVPDTGGVWVVPALQGLGTPHLDPDARALIGGLSRGASRAHLVRATLEGIAHRCREVIDALRADWPEVELDVLRVDGGAAANDFLLQYQSDILGLPVERPATVQAAALGAAYLAGLAAGIWAERAEIEAAWRLGRRFEPRMSPEEREERHGRWREKAVLARSAGARPM